MVVDGHRLHPEGLPELAHAQPVDAALVGEAEGRLETLAAMVDAGSVRPVMDRTYPLRELAGAMAHVGTGHTRGKVAITV